MKQLIKHVRRLSAVASLLISVAGFIGFFMPALAISNSSVADEIISLHVTDRPLGEVLENLSTAANCQFTISERWKDYPVTASIDNEPLYRGNR